MKTNRILAIAALLCMMLTSCISSSQTEAPMQTPSTAPTAAPAAAPVTSPEASESTVVPEAETDLFVHFIDVGQADSVLVQNDGENMLIDGGNVGDSSLVVSYLKDCGVETIDYMVCTHAHEDHGGGLSGPLRVFDVESVLAPKTGSDANFYQDFLSGVYAQGLTITNPDPGYTFNVGDASVTVLGPITESTDNKNDTSLVLKLVSGKTSFLFTGDAETDEEHDIANQGYDMDVDVLKVGHHGAKNASSYVFLREAMPEYAVISVGKDNSYGHPTEEALSRLRDVGAKVYRTDLQGHIVAKSDGQSITFTTQKNASAQTNPTTVEKVESNYIGNKNSKKLHKPTCGSLPKESNRVYFSTMEAGLSQGYVECKNCF